MDIAEDLDSVRATKVSPKVQQKWTEAEQQKYVAWAVVRDGDGAWGWGFKEGNMSVDSGSVVGVNETYDVFFMILE